MRTVGLLRRRDPPQLVEEVQDDTTLSRFRAFFRSARLPRPRTARRQDAGRTSGPGRRRVARVWQDARLLSAERVALDRIGRDHDLSVQAVEQLASRSRPDWKGAAAGRDPPSVAAAAKRPHVHFISTRLVRLIREPSPVRREVRLLLRERTVEERDRRSSLPARVRRLPPSGRIIRSQLVSEVSSSKARNLPLGCQETGHCGCLASVRRSALPVPSVRCQYRLGGWLSRFELNTMRRPSGVHTALSVTGWMARQRSGRVAVPLVDPDVGRSSGKDSGRAGGHRARNGC